MLAIGVYEWVDILLFFFNNESDRILMVRLVMLANHLFRSSNHPERAKRGEGSKRIEEENFMGVNPWMNCGLDDRRSNNKQYKVPRALARGVPVNGNTHKICSYRCL